MKAGMFKGDSVEVGWGHDEFSRSYGMRYDFKRSARSFLSKRFQCSFNQDKNFPGIRTRRYLAARKSRLNEIHSRLDGHDLVILNCEGTIHDDQPTSLGLIALCETASEAGVPVFSVNGTIHQMSKDMMGRFCRSCQAISVRERISAAYMARYDCECAVIPDALFSAFDEDLYLRNTGRANTFRCAYTPGVLSLYGKLSKSRFSACISAIRKNCYDPELLLVEKEDTRFVAMAEDLGVKICSVMDCDAKETSQVLRRYDMIVSGRYHICIYAAMVGLPFIAQASNTPKMQGVMDLLGADQDMNKPIHSLDWHSLAKRRVPLSTLKELSLKASLVTKLVSSGNIQDFHAISG